jgi:hypothetical protein
MMISAFGVEHGEVSKSLKPNHVQAMSRTLTGATNKGTNGDRARAFSRARLASNKKGAQAAVARPGNRDPKGNPEYSPTVNGSKIANGPRAWKPEPTRYPTRPR